MTKKYNVAVIGATGNVGRETLNILAERDFPVKNIYAIASSSSLGKEVSFGDSVIKIQNIDNLDFNKVDIVFFSAGSKVSKQYAPIAANSGCVVIDKSSYFRLDKKVPLIVPEANPNKIRDFAYKNIIANPNCCAIPLAVVLKPLDNAAKIKRLIISTYQSTSGAGKAAMDELYSQTKARYVFEEVSPSVLQRPIAFNLIPQIGDIEDNGESSEEQKIALELEKIIGEHIKVAVTCVRVPVFVGHSMSVNIEFENKLAASEAYELLNEADGVQVLSMENQLASLTPIDVVGEDKVFVGRIREDRSKENALNLWVATDNLRKGAALNAVQIAEQLILDQSFISFSINRYTNIAS